MCTFYSIYLIEVLKLTLDVKMVSLDDFLHGVGCSPTTRWLLCKILRQFFVGKGISPEDTDLLIAHMSTFTDMKRLNVSHVCISGGIGVQLHYLAY